MSYRKRSGQIDTSPANDDWKADDTRKRKPAKSKRKENPTPASEPDTSDDGYWDSILRDCDFKHK